MTECNRRVERQMQADYERLQPSPVVSEWMQGQRMNPKLHKAVVAFKSGDAHAWTHFLLNSAEPRLHLRNRATFLS